MTESNAIVGIRDRLGLTVIELAELLGVSHSTAFRWERNGYDLSKIEPFQRRLLILIEGLQNENETSVNRALGAEIRQALIKGGTLLGLYTLLDHVYDGKEPAS